jgi:type II secretory pathway component HofQ
MGARLKTVVALLGLAILGVGAAAAPAPGVLKDPETDSKGTAIDEASAQVRDGLNATVNFQGFEDPKTTLVEALDALAKIYNVQFDVNEKAFEADKVDKVLRAEIAAPNPVPPMKVPLRMVLTKILLRVPSKSGAMILIRPKGVLEVTTEKAVKEELGIPEGRPLLPLVYEDFDDKPLSAALRTLASSSGFSIVLDRHAGGDRAGKVTAGLHNVPVDTAVKVLAEMADLAVVRLDNVFYVTSREKAARLQADQAPPAAGKAPEKPAAPTPSPEPKKEPSKPAP